MVSAAAKYKIVPTQDQAIFEHICRGTRHFDVKRTQDTATDDARKVPLRIYTPNGHSAKKLPVLVYFHGGGWVTGKQTSTFRVSHAVKTLQHDLIALLAPSECACMHQVCSCIHCIADDMASKA